MASKDEGLHLPARSLTVLQKSVPSKLKWKWNGDDELLSIPLNDSIVLEGSVDWSRLVQNYNYKLTLTLKLTGYHDITIQMLAYPPFQQVLSKNINLSPTGELKVLNGPEFLVAGLGVMNFYVIVLGNVPPDDELYVKGVDVVPVA